MADESFYCATLTEKDNTVEWDVLSNDRTFPRGQKLIIKQILLGAAAKQDEFNVVEVFTSKDSFKTPLAILKAGEVRAVNPDVEFSETSVIFKLIKGSGPVYIHGQNLKDEVEVVDWNDEETDEEEEDEDDYIENQPKKRQRENENDEKNARQKK